MECFGCSATRADTVLGRCHGGRFLRGEKQPLANPQRHGCPLTPVHVCHSTTSVAQWTLQIFKCMCLSFILLSLPPLLASDLVGPLFGEMHKSDFFLDVYVCILLILRFMKAKYWKCACYDWPIHWEIIMVCNFIKDWLVSYISDKHI